MTPLNRPWLFASTILSIALTWVVYRQFANDLTNAGTWGCEMSWMTPSYVEIPWEASPMKRYRLFWYREQGWDKEEQPSGLPVIFVPGNAGSYSQVRSIASSASRQFYGETRGQEEFPSDTSKLDFFTVDLNEEFSALHGPTLLQQAAYVAAAIQHVRSLYPGARNPPVILLGHSMGGIVARLAAKNADEASVSFIVTMATPHTISPAPIDATTESVYTDLASYQKQRPSPLLVSICGGLSDTQVVSDTCALGPPDLDEKDGFTVFTSGLPGAWTAVDHQAIVWCHQIRWAVARALLEAGNANARDIRLAKLKRWLSDDVVDRQGSTSVGEKHRIQVADSSMAILARWGSTALPQIFYCPTQSSCRPVEANVSRIPWLKDETKPFPLVGEGVHTDDVAGIFSVQLESVTGHLEIEASEILGHGASALIGSVKSLDWRSNTGIDTPLHFSLHLPINAASLASYQLDYETPQCQGHSPVITARYTCGGLTEMQVFAGSKRRGSLSNHIISAPFIHRVCTPGVELDITQDKACPVSHISASLAIGPSLAKAVMRYRMAAVTWGIGWLALASARKCSQLPMSLVSALDGTLRQSWKTALLLLGGCALQSLAWKLPLVPSLIVGQGNFVISACFAVLLAVWTAGFAGIAIVAFESVAKAPSKVQNGATASASKSLPAKLTLPTPSPSYTLGFSQALISILFSLYLPHQLISLVLLAFLWRSVPHDEGTHRGTIARIGTYLLTLSMPFDAVILPVWGRYIWADWRHPFPSDRNIIGILPPLVFLLAVEYGRAGEAALMGRNRYVRWLLLGLAGMTFALGARYPFLVRAGIELVLVALSINLVCI